MFRGHKGKERREIFIAAAAMQTIVKPLADLLSELIEDDAKAELVSTVYCSTSVYFTDLICTVTYMPTASVCVCFVAHLVVIVQY